MSIESLARLMLLSPAQAVALPVTLDRAAALVGLTRDQMVAQAARKPALLAYLADVCRKATK